jgi:hypothetical protein
MVYLFWGECKADEARYSTYFTQMDPMRWTSQMEGYLKNIEANPEHPNDQSLTLLVRLQLLGQRATQARDEHQGPFPIAMFLNSWRAQLDTLRDSLPVVHPNKGTPRRQNQEEEKH